MRFKLSSKFVRGFFYAPQMSRKKKKRSLKQVSKQNNVKKYRLEICQRLETRILPRIVKIQVQGDQRVANKRRNNRLPVYISGDAFSCFSFTVTARHDDVYDIYIYTRTQLATSVKGKREKEAIVSAAFGQQAGKLYEVLSATSSFHFTGRRLLLREFKRRERPIQSGGSLSTIFLRSFRFLLCSSLCLSLSATDLSFYQRRSAKLSSNFISFPFLFMFFFYSSGPFERRYNVFSFNFNKVNVEIYIL